MALKNNFLKKLSASLLFSDVAPLLNRGRKQAQSINLGELADLVEIDRLLAAEDQYPDYAAALRPLRGNAFSAIKSFEKKLLWQMGSIHFVDVVLSLLASIASVLILHLYESGNLERSALWAVVLALLVFFLNSLSTALHSIKIDKEMLASYRIKSKLNLFLFEHTLQLPRARRMNYSTGDLLNFASEDSTHLSHYYAHAYVDGFVLVSTSALLVGILVAFVGPSALVGLAVLVLHIPLCIVFSRMGEKLNFELMRRTSDRLTLITEWIQAMRVVRYFGWGRHFLAQIVRLNRNEYTQLAKIHANYSGAFALSTSWWMLVAIGTLGSFYLSSGMPSVTQVFGVIWLSARLGSQLNPLPWFLSERALAKVSGKRLSDFFANPTLHETLKISEAEPNLGSSSKQAPQAFSFDSLGFEIEKVILSFDERSGCDTMPLVQKRVALNIDELFIAPGSSLAVIGEVGSGKTLLQNMLVGELPPSSGRLDLCLFDQGILVQKIALYSKEGLEIVRNSTAIVAQKSAIFSATVRENVPFVLGREFQSPTTADKEIIRSLALSQLNQDIKTFPQGLSTFVGERGINLSGGQKQRLSLSRALFANSLLVVLDDPLSAVDRDTEQLLLDEYFVELKKRKATVVLSTHRLLHLKRFDNILLLENGKVKCMGPSASLLENSMVSEWLRSHGSGAQQ